MDRNNPPPIKTKLKYVKNVHIFKTTIQKKGQHSAKWGGDRFNLPPPPIKSKEIS